MTTTESTPATGRGRTSAADRVPVPTRQRRPGLAALAIVLILGGAALSGYLAITSGNKTSVIALARDVDDGNLITAADLTTISVSAPGVNTVPASDMANIVNKYRANGTYPRGMILVQGMLQGRHIPGDGYLSIALIVPEGQFPPQTITPGSAVKVIYSPKGSGGASQNGNSAPTVNLPAGGTLVDSAYVVSTKSASNGGGIFVIVVPDGGQEPQKLANLVNANAQSAITLLKLPEGTRPPTGQGQS